ncbi:Uncharacterised protein [Kluyvera intermedia]|nr:Uncharacterised protein [Kluyvera intermedia]
MISIPMVLSSFAPITGLHSDAPTFARNLIGTKDDAGNFTEIVLNGEPVDILDDVFISVRVEMPTDSVYNLSLLESRAEQQLPSETDDNC